MTLLVPTASLAQRIDVGPKYVHAGVELKESELDWKDNPYKPGEQRVVVTVGHQVIGPRKLRRPVKLHFERQRPKP